MSRRRGNQHLRRSPANMSRGVDLAKLQRDRLMDSIGAFAENMAQGTGMPMVVCAEYVLMMLTTEDFERHCAACNEVHTNRSALSWYHHADTNTTILWSACEDCAEAPGMRTTAIPTLEAWATGEADPEGLVVIFAPPPAEVVESEDTPSD